MTDALQLRPMRADEFGAFERRVTDEFANDLSEHGDTPIETARARSVAAMRDALPDGQSTPGHWIHVLQLDGEDVGVLWLAERTIDDRRVIFIYDVEIDAAYRGRGLGRAAMLLAEREALARGIRRIELNVFGGNTVARKLYTSLGYVERAVLMAKDLDAS